MGLGGTISVFCLTALALLFATPASAAEHASTLQEQEAVAVTIYSDDLALIKDTRRLTLPKGQSRLVFRDVSAQMQPESALLRVSDARAGIRVLEQSFEFDLLTPQKLLEKYLGRQVGIIKTHPTTGQETVEQAVVLSAADGVVLKIGDRIETGVPGRLSFPELPESLRNRPTLSMTVESAIDQPQVLELSYLTRGLGWKADYVAELSSDDASLALNGWVTLTNTSGASFHNALLQLVAGDVHRAAPREGRQRLLKTDAEPMMAAAAAPEMVEQGLLEYHLYTLPRPASIPENQSMQVALLAASRVACAFEHQLVGQERYYWGRVEELGDKLPVELLLTLTNSAKSGLGLPLPRGVVRVYKQDSAKHMQFVGEDSLDHTPEQAAIRLKLGNAFDVTGQRKQTDFKKIAAGDGPRAQVYESSYQVVISNARPEAVMVKVVEPLPGDWEIVSESIPHEKTSATRAVWQVQAPARGNATLSYTARVKQ